MDLFEQSADKELHAPLAERLRPRDLEGFLGQLKHFGEKSPLKKMLLKGDYLPNLIFWGPPGTGKTTMARILSNYVKAQFVSANAIDTGAKELKNIGQAARDRRMQFTEKTLLFIDEIHRLNRAQQDVLLPFMERGDFVLVGATTENPGYELNSALLSRAQVVVFERHTEEDLKTLFIRALSNSEVLEENLLTKESLQALVTWADGDARRLLNATENLINTFQFAKESFDFPLSEESLFQILQTRSIQYDKNKDQHYDCISAFIKSVRGSDPNAAVYYLARMLAGGEDPVFIARRLVILASEDVGNADPKALEMAVAGLHAVELIGMPECAINLSQVATYMACAPKSNRSYKAIKMAQKFVEETGSIPVPKHLRSSQTKLSKELGHGKGYEYSHDYPRGYSGQKHLPEEIQDQVFYEPGTHGFEKKMLEYLGWLRGEPSVEPNKP